MVWGTPLRGVVWGTPLHLLRSVSYAMVAGLSRGKKALATTRGRQGPRPYPVGGVAPPSKQCPTSYATPAGLSTGEKWPWPCVWGDVSQSRLLLAAWEEAPTQGQQMTRSYATRASLSMRRMASIKRSVGAQAKALAVWWYLAQADGQLSRYGLSSETSWNFRTMTYFRTLTTSRAQLWDATNSFRCGCLAKYRRRCRLRAVFGTSRT